MPKTKRKQKRQQFLESKASKEINKPIKYHDDLDNAQKKVIGLLFEGYDNNIQEENYLGYSGYFYKKNKDYEPDPKYDFTKILKLDFLRIIFYTQLAMMGKNEEERKKIIETIVEKIVEVLSTGKEIYKNKFVRFSIFNPENRKLYKRGEGEADLYETIKRGFEKNTENFKTYFKGQITKLITNNYDETLVRKNLENCVICDFYKISQFDKRDEIDANILTTPVMILNKIKRVVGDIYKASKVNNKLPKVWKEVDRWRKTVDKDMLQFVITSGTLLVIIAPIITALGIYTVGVPNFSSIENSISSVMIYGSGCAMIGLFCRKLYEGMVTIRKPIFLSTKETRKIIAKTLEKFVAGQKIHYEITKEQDGSVATPSLVYLKPPEIDQDIKAKAALREKKIAEEVARLAKKPPKIKTVGPVVEEKNQPQDEKKVGGELDYQKNVSDEGDITYKISGQRKKFMYIAKDTIEELRDKPSFKKNLLWNKVEEMLDDIAEFGENTIKIAPAGKDKVKLRLPYRGNQYKILADVTKDKDGNIIYVMTSEVLTHKELIKESKRTGHLSDSIQITESFDDENKDEEVIEATNEEEETAAASEEGEDNSPTLEDERQPASSLTLISRSELKERSSSREQDS